MQLKAKDTMHISSVKAENIRPGEKFTVSDVTGRDLIKRGLAEQVKPRARKAAAAPANKKAAEPKNK